MHCERARELLSPYLDGELSPEEQRSMAAHIEECDRCARLAKPSLRPHRPHHCRGGARGPPTRWLRAFARRWSRRLLPRGRERSLACQARRGRLGTDPPADAPSRSAGCGLCAHRLGHVVGGERVRSAKKARAGGGVGSHPLASAGEADRGRLLRYAHGQAVYYGPRRLLARGQGSHERGLRAAWRSRRLHRRPPGRRARLQAALRRSTRSTCSCGRARGTRARRRARWRRRATTC